MKHTSSTQCKKSHEKVKVQVPPPKDISRLEGKVSERAERTSEEDLRTSSNFVSPDDVNFKADLDYNGYEDIEDYDNNAFDLNVDKERDEDLDVEPDLNFEGREEDDLDPSEESPIDPQKNQ